MLTPPSHHPCHHSVNTTPTSASISSTPTKGALGRVWHRKGASSSGQPTDRVRVAMTATNPEMGACVFVVDLGLHHGEHEVVGQAKEGGGCSQVCDNTTRVVVSGGQPPI
ncbi:hypothetical protein Tco_1484581 [Tanacetum coccineum]